MSLCADFLLNLIYNSSIMPEHKRSVGLFSHTDFSFEKCPKIYMLFITYTMMYWTLSINADQALRSGTHSLQILHITFAFVSYDQRRVQVFFCPTAVHASAYYSLLENNCQLVKSFLWLIEIDLYANKILTL